MRAAGRSNVEPAAVEPDALPPAAPRSLELRFGRCTVQPAQRRVLIDGQPVRLGGRAFDLLLALIDRRERVVAKAELAELVWPGIVVEDNNLTVQMASLRKVLGTDAIATIAGRGYQFVATVDTGPAGVGATLQTTAQAAMAGAAAVPGARGLPAELDAFVGRGSELAELAAMLDAGARLVTIVGTAGAGKTRLACRFAWSRLADWPGGVFFCDLSEARSRAGIASAAATTLDVTLGAEDAVAQLGQVLAGRGRCLVVLDNFEQVVGHAAATLQPWLEHAVQARFLVTSRERLSLKGERLLALEPLVPAREGIELFAVRARARKADFELTADNRADVERIVTLIDGLPLAVELAAARVQVLAPAQLLARLQDRFRVLADPRAASARQGTLRSAIDWSWTLLAPWEQAALAQASVFAGPFTLEDAEAVIDLSPWTQAPPVIDVMQLLLDKSLLRLGAPAAGGAGHAGLPRFAMLVSIHEYAADKLESGAVAPSATPSALDAVAVQQRHGRCFAARGTDEALAALDRHGGTALQKALAADLENLVAACRRAAQRHDGRVAARCLAAVWWVLSSSGPFDLGVELGRDVLALPSLEPHDRARVLAVLGQALRRTGRADEAEARTRAALALHQQLGDRRGVADTQIALGSVLVALHARYDEAMVLLEQGLATARELGDVGLEASALGNLSVALDLKGRQQAALPLYLRALDLHRSAGNLRMAANTLVNLGSLYEEAQRHDDALRCAEEALAIARETGDRRTEGHALGAQGLTLLLQGRLAAARTALDAALAIATDTGNRRFESNMRRNLGDLLLREGRLEAAVAQFELGLALAREAGHRLGEGRLQGHLGQGLSALGRHEGATAAFAAGAERLRSLQAWVELGQLLCRQGHCELAAGDSATARRCLDEIVALAAAHGAAPEAALGVAATSLRRAIDDALDLRPGGAG
ncbi:MAG: tetratricopeptide repeat protein [Nitrospira sp.]|nr:tetratricopeptide repeat protein [Nitrospira sp.]